MSSFRRLVERVPRASRMNLVNEENLVRLKVGLYGGLLFFSFFTIIAVPVTTVCDPGGALVSLYPSPRYVTQGGGPCILVSVTSVCDPGVALVALYPCILHLGM